MSQLSRAGLKDSLCGPELLVSNNSFFAYSSKLFRGHVVEAGTGPSVPVHLQCWVRVFGDTLVGTGYVILWVPC